LDVSREPRHLRITRGDYEIHNYAGVRFTLFDWLVNKACGNNS